MSLTDIFSSARSGLNAAQAALKTVSTNIANVGTPGYAREAVSLTTAVVQGRVAGVTVGEPRRIADQFLEDLVYGRAGQAGQAEATNTPQALIALLQHWSSLNGGLMFADGLE